MKAWTPQERSRAIQWRNHGRTPAFIADRLGRATDEVAEFLAANKRGAVKPTQKTERKCLGCGRKFMSDGAHNRMCDSCRRNSCGVPPGMVDTGDGCRVAGSGRHG